jgi:hypothetical protein
MDGNLWVDFFAVNFSFNKEQPKIKRRHFYNLQSLTIPTLRVASRWVVKITILVTYFCFLSFTICLCV